LFNKKLFNTCRFSLLILWRWWKIRL
jgi:hypothetical protein